MRSHLAIGTILKNGTYKIIQLLGQGSFGITYLAEHIGLEKKVCIKEFFMKDVNLRGDDGSVTGMSDGTLSFNYAQKFRKEALNLARIDHPHIVRVIDSFVENETFYYTMDYIDGQNLNDYISTHRPTEQQAVAIVKDVAQALQYMHDVHKMLHLDLKPGNIMRRSSDGHVFLIDFGLSKHFSENGQPETSTSIGLGTAGYAPIEQGNQAKNGEFRPSIDVYALGATLFKLLTGETPPAASELVSDFDVLAERMGRAGVSPQLMGVVCNAMQPSIKKRIATVSQFVAQIDRLPAKNDQTLYYGGEEIIAEVVEDIEVQQPNTQSTQQANTEKTEEDEDTSAWLPFVVFIVGIFFIIIIVAASTNGCSRRSGVSSGYYEEAAPEEAAPAEEEVALPAAPAVPAEEAIEYY